MVRAAGDAKIVHCQLGINPGQQPGHHGTAFRCLSVTNGNGIHMDADFTAQFVQNLPLHPVNDIVNSGDITVFIHLGVQRGEQPARAVIMDDEIVQAENFRRGQHPAANAIHQFGIGRPAQQRINGILHGVVAGIQNKYRHQNAQVAIQLNMEEVPGQGAQQYHRCGGHITEAVSGGGHHGGGIDLFPKLAVEEVHPALYQYGNRQNDQRQPAEFHRRGGEDLLERRFAQFKAHKQDDHRNGKPGEILDAPVPERMVPIGFLPSQPETDERDHRGAGIG